MNPTKETFRRDTAGHRLTVLLDQGVYRHLLFKNPKSSCYHFHIVTYPGALVFSGDMGAYTFERLPDMFEFFTESKPNLGYWAEKVQAQDRHDGIEEFSFSKFKERVGEDVETFIEDSGWSKESKALLAEDIADELGALPQGDGQSCFNWACGDYSFTCEEGEFSFQDFWEHNCREYSFRFVWCCWAIIYAIAQYKNHKELPA